MKNIIRKIATVGATSIGLLGATVGGALAADLSDLDTGAPFVSSGDYVNVAMVVGASSDDVGARDTLRDYFDGFLTGDVTSEESSQFDKSSDFLELYQEIHDAKDVFTNSDLSTALVDFDVKGKTSTDVKQYMRFDGLTQSDADTATVIYAENNDDEQELFLFYNDGDYIFEYEMEFSSGYDSDNSSNDLEDWDNDEWQIMGDTFVIVDADLDGTKLTINLMSGAESDTIGEGETKSYTLDGSTYDVELLYVESGKAKFIVNGETTTLIDEGDTYTLDDDSKIGVSDVLYQDYAGGVHQADFYIGANSIDLVDDDYTDTSYDSDGVTIGDESIEDAQVKLTGSVSGTEFTLTNLKYQLKADGEGGDVYVGDGESVRDWLDEPEGMLSGSWDLRFRGLTDENTETISLSPDGDEAYKLEFTNQAGHEYNIDFLNNESVAKFGGDESDEDLWFKEVGFFNVNGTPVVANVYIDAGDSFVLSDSVVGSAEEDTDSYVIEYNSIDTGDNELTFNYAGTSEDISVSYAAGTAGDVSAWTNYIAANSSAVTNYYHGDLIVGGNTYDVIINETSEKIAINLDGGATGIATDEVGVVTQYGAIIDLGTQASPSSVATSSTSVTITTDGEMMDSESTDEVSTVTMSYGAEMDLTMGSAALTGSDASDPYDAAAAMVSEEGDSTHKVGYTVFGAMMDLTEPSDDPATLIVEYPEEQRGPMVYAEYGGVVSASAPAIVTSSSDVSGYSNLILVGGPCVNSVTATWMGVSAGSCGTSSGIPENDALIEIKSMGDQTALIVAGWEKADTSSAAGKVSSGGLTGPSVYASAL